MQVDDERSADVDVDVYSSLEAKYRFYQPVPSALGRRRRIRWKVNGAGRRCKNLAAWDAYVDLRAPWPANIQFKMIEELDVCR